MTYLYESELLDENAPDRQVFWDEVDRVRSQEKFSPLLNEIVRGMCALQANNEAAARNITANDFGGAQTRDLFHRLLAFARQRGYMSEPRDYLR